MGLNESSFSSVVASVTNTSNSAKLQVPNGCTNGILVVSVNAFLPPTITISGNGLLNYTETKTLTAYQGSYSGNLKTSIYNCQLNPNEYINISFSTSDTRILVITAFILA